MASAWENLVGTVSSFFRIGLTGPRLKNNAGALNVRNAGDSADAAITAAAATFSGAIQGTVLNLTGTTITVNSDAAEAGSDWKLVFVTNASMTQNLTLTFPADDGTSGQVLQTDGSGNLSWVSAAGTADLDHYESTSLAFGSGTTVSMFTLPVNAYIECVEVIIDTAFNGTPSMSVGKTGAASKYVASTEVDLTMTAGTVFRIYPAQTPVGTTEDLEIAYTAGSASAGAARVVVHYAVPG